MSSVGAFSIDFLLGKNPEEDARSISSNSSEEEVLPTTETDGASREFPGKNILFVTDRLPSFLYGNSTETLVKQYKNSRTCFTIVQKNELEKSFRQSPYLHPHALQKLIQLGLSKASIQNWYKNRRYKRRRQNEVTSMPRSAHSQGAFLSMRTGCIAPYSAGSCLGHCPLLCQTEMPPCCAAPPSCTLGVSQCPLSKDGERASYQNS